MMISNRELAEALRVAASAVARRVDAARERGTEEPGSARAAEGGQVDGEKGKIATK
ncbi:MAG TPA: winged helix-turn-helix domain-containing protein [Blastocatellia bacterium]|nr:winged helix-turn-helix domain-containing protein [Blastocatellia bacterium]